MKKLVERVLLTLLIAASTVVSARDIYTNVITKESETNEEEGKYTLALEETSKENYAENIDTNNEIDEASIREIVKEFIEELFEAEDTNILDDDIDDYSDYELEDEYYCIDDYSDYELEDEYDCTDDYSDYELEDEYDCTNDYVFESYEEEIDEDEEGEEEEEYVDFEDELELEDYITDDSNENNQYEVACDDEYSSDLEEDYDEEDCDEEDYDEEDCNEEDCDDDDCHEGRYDEQEFEAFEVHFIKDNKVR